ncbi:MAG: DNA-directed DNA polymerase, partial [Candidatus Aenigmatarchaeota archaeon]
MKCQLLDADYTLLSGKPLVRLFCKTMEGETVCIFWDKHLPYFYVQGQPENFPAILEGLKKRWPELKGDVVEKRIPNGFSVEPSKVLRITGKDPSIVPEQREMAIQLGGTPFEADVLFKYRTMIDMGLRGMSWLEVEGTPARTETVKCRAIDATSIIPIEEMDNAPLRHLAFDIETVADADRPPEASKDPIVMVGMAFSPAWRGKNNIVLVAKHCGGENTEEFSDEASMLKRFGDIIKDYDPDALIGYNINGYDLPYLLERLERLNLPRDIGRTSKSAWLKKLATGAAPSVAGRVVIDPYDILKRDPWVKFKRYDLRTVAKEMLKAEKLEMSGASEIRQLWRGNVEGIARLVEYNRRDSELALRLVIEKQLLDKFVQIARISGLLLQDTFGGQSQRLENLLLHEFRKSGYIMPCKPDGNELKKRRDERERLGLKGAIVLEPTIGLHIGGCTLVLDFTSLYPSVIRLFNICPTTLFKGDDSTMEVNTSPQGVKFVKPSVRVGILPKVVTELIETRAAVKKAAKAAPDAETKRILNAKQLALKDMSNSLYGYTGYIRSRLYIMDVANSITGYGRANIMRTRELVETGFPKVKVIYGDTDSVFIKTDVTDLDEATKLGETISQHVTSNLTGLKFAFEKIFRTFLILTKKRYAGWAWEKTPEGWKDKIEMKGIETVRRDWCDLVSITMKDVLETVLKQGDVKAASARVRGLVKDLTAGRIPLDKLTVVKGVTRALESYEGMQPHVELAKKLKARDPMRG